MAEALFVRTKDLKEFSVLSGNLDEDKVKQYIKIAQDTHLEQYLGTDLKQRLQAGIIADDLTSNETSLLDTYVKPMTIHWALVEYLGFAAYTIADKGVYKHFSENSETVTKSEIDALVERHRNIAEMYTDRFHRYMCYNKDLFPEYDSNTDEDINPINPQPFSGWQL